MLGTWYTAAVIFVSHPEALTCFLLPSPEWTEEGSWPLAIQLSREQRGVSGPNAPHYLKSVYYNF